MLTRVEICAAACFLELLQHSAATAVCRMKVFHVHMRFQIIFHSSNSLSFPSCVLDSVCEWQIRFSIFFSLLNKSTWYEAARRRFWKFNFVLRSIIKRVKRNKVFFSSFSKLLIFGFQFCTHKFQQSSLSAVESSNKHWLCSSLFYISYIIHLFT